MIMTYCKLCNNYIPDIKVSLGDDDLGIGTKWKDICQPCMDLIKYAHVSQFRRYTFNNY
jgi:hypothetical protein